MTPCAILVDSGCAPTTELLKTDNVYHLGMKIHLDNDTLIDGEDLELDRFYTMIDRVKDFQTTPPLVWDIKQKYEDIKRRGHTSLISIHVSSKMSKLLETCENARNMVGGIDVHLLDSRNLSIGSYLIAQKVIDLLQQGIPIDKLDGLMPDIRKSSHMQIFLSTLKYLIKSKRIGRVQGVLGSMLSIKPILGIDEDGYLTTLSKERGGNRVIKHIAESALEFLAKRRHNVKICLTWGFDENRMHVDRVYDQFMQDFPKLGIKQYQVVKSRMWPTLACNCGPGAYGFAVYGEERPIA